MIRGKSRPVRQEIGLEASIHNRFDIEVRDSRTGEIRQRAQAFNIICDALWTRMLGGNNAPWFAYILYGKGSGTPAAEDTELFSKLGAVSVNTGSYGNYSGINEVASLDEVNGTYSLRRSNAIDETVAVGETITEIGIGYDDTHIVTHAMLQDMNGNPISITKTATDIITFYATVYVHWSAAGYQNGKIVVVPMRAVSGRVTFLWDIATGGFDGSLIVYPGMGASFGVLKGNGNEIYRSGSLVKAATNKTLGFSGMRFPVGDANGELYGFTIAFGDRTSASTNRGMLPGVYIDADVFDRTSWAITGEAVGTGDGSTTDFATNFGVRSGAKVYVDGVENASTTVRTGPKDSVHPGQYFDVIDDHGAVLPNYPITTERMSNDYASKTVYYRNSHLMAIDGYHSENHPWYGTVSAVSAVEYSGDLSTWTAVSAIQGENNDWTFSAPVTALYWRVTYASITNAIFYFFNSAGSATNIHFSTAPASGAVITADYVPDCIPKDSDHVFDLSLTITLGEYTGS